MNRPRGREINRVEEQFHRAVVEWLQLVRPFCLWWYTPNEGYRTKAEAGIQKALGVKKGVPDLIFVTEGGRIRFIELKAPGKTLSAAQQEFFLLCTDFNISYGLAYTLQDVSDLLGEWGIQLGRKVVFQ